MNELLVVPLTIEQQILAELKKHTDLLECVLNRLDDDRPVLGPDGKPLDITDVIHEINPTPTPFLASVGKKKR